MSYIIPIGNGSFVSAKNGWFCVSCAVTRKSLGYYSWIMVGYRVPGHLTMFVFHLSSFPFISTSPPRYNTRIVLLQTRAFWRYPLCRGLTRKSGSCSGMLTTMVANGGNAPLTPHTRHFTSFRCVRLMGDDPPSKRI